MAIPNVPMGVSDDEESALLRKGRKDENSPNHAPSPKSAQKKLQLRRLLRKASESALTEQLRANTRRMWAKRVLGGAGGFGVLLLLSATVWSSIIQPHLVSRPSWPGNAAFGMTAVAFAVSDVLWLRILAILSNMFTILFNYWHPVGQTLWLPIKWNVLYVVINVWRILVLLKDRIVILSAAEKKAFHTHFEDTMSSQDFQKLIRLASFSVPTDRQVILTEGERTSHLILLLAGSAEVDLGDGVIIQQGAGIIGESSFLAPGRRASATVYVSPGCEYYSWDQESLQVLKKTSTAAARGLELAIGRELSRKLSNTTSKYRELQKSSRYSHGDSHRDSMREDDDAV